MTQHLNLDFDIAQNEELTITDKVIYSTICDRMKSSVKRIQFYDNKARAYYVIYPIDEMCKFWHLSRNTVIKSYKHLASLGFLVKERVFNGSNKLFLPTFDVEAATTYESDVNHVTTESKETDNSKTAISSETGPSKVQKVNFNHSNLNHNKHIDTDNTKKLEKIKFDNLKKNLVKQGGFDEHSANLLALYSFGNPDDLYSVAGTIYKAKKTIANKYPEYAYDLLLEHNNNLANTVKNISIHAGKAKNRMGYIFKSYLAYFEDIVLQSKAQNSRQAVPDIPIFKLI